MDDSDDQLTGYTFPSNLLEHEQTNVLVLKDILSQLDDETIVKDKEFPVHLRNLISIHDISVIVMVLQTKALKNMLVEESADKSALSSKFNSLINREIEYRLHHHQRIVFEGLNIDPGCRIVEVRDQVVILPRIEFDLLWFFARHPYQVFTRPQLLNSVWGYNYEGEESTVTVHICRLRNKIEPDANNPTYIHTVWGVGYKFGLIS